MGYTYAGQERDPTSGAMSIGARHYLPAIGKWASPDPLFLRSPATHPDRPAERDLYRYAANDPVALVDRDGTSAWTKLAKAAGAVIKGGSAIDAILGAVQDAETLVNSDAPMLDRLVAGASLLSEVLPVSIGDARDVVDLSRRALRSADSVTDGVRSTRRTITTSQTPSSTLRAAPKRPSAPEHGTFHVDPHGNVLATPQGGSVTGSPNGRYLQVRDASGAATGTRIDGPHRPAGHPDKRAQRPHAHVPGVTNADGTPWLPIKGTDG